MNDRDAVLSTTLVLIRPTGNGSEVSRHLAVSRTGVLACWVPNDGSVGLILEVARHGVVSLLLPDGVRVHADSVALDEQRMIVLAWTVDHEHMVCWRVPTPEDATEPVAEIAPSTLVFDWATRLPTFERDTSLDAGGFRFEYDYDDIRIFFGDEHRAVQAHPQWSSSEWHAPMCLLPDGDTVLISSEPRKSWHGSFSLLALSLAQLRNCLEHGLQIPTKFIAVSEKDGYYWSPPTLAETDEVGETTLGAATVGHNLWGAGGDIGGERLVIVGEQRIQVRKWPELHLLAEISSTFGRDVRARRSTRPPTLI